MRPSVKRGIRRVGRGLGYEIVPARAGLGALQTRLLRDIRLVIDVGANVGQYGDRIRSLGYEGQMVSFEPQKLAYGQLSHVAVRDANWEVRNLALGESPGGQAELFNSANSVSSSLHQVLQAHIQAAPKARSVGSEWVSLSTLDSEFPTLMPDAGVWLKLDVQGHELQALKGGERTLCACEAVQVELSFTSLYEGQSMWLDVCTLLIQAGFQLQYLDPGFEDPITGAMQQADGLFTRRR